MKLKSLLLSLTEQGLFIKFWSRSSTVWGFYKRSHKFWRFHKFWRSHTCASYTFPGASRKCFQIFSTYLFRYWWLSTSFGPTQTNFLFDLLCHFQICSAAWPFLRKFLRNARKT